MLTQPLLDKLAQLRLSAFRAALEEQMHHAQYAELSFEDRLSLLVGDGPGGEVADTAPFTDRPEDEIVDHLPPSSGSLQNDGCRPSRSPVGPARYRRAPCYRAVRSGRPSIPLESSRWPGGHRDRRAGSVSGRDPRRSPMQPLLGKTALRGRILLVAVSGRPAGRHRWATRTRVANTRRRTPPGT